MELWFRGSALPPRTGFVGAALVRGWFGTAGFAKIASVNLIPAKCSRRLIRDSRLGAAVFGAWFATLDLLATYSFVASSPVPFLLKLVLRCGSALSANQPTMRIFTVEPILSPVLRYQHRPAGAGLWI